MKNQREEVRDRSIRSCSGEILFQSGYENWNIARNFVEFPIWITVKEEVRRGIMSETLKLIHEEGKGE
jgi:hypothetical protein